MPAANRDEYLAALSRIDYDRMIYAAAYGHLNVRLALQEVHVPDQSLSHFLNSGFPCPALEASPLEDSAEQRAPG